MVPSEIDKKCKTLIKDNFDTEQNRNITETSKVFEVEDVVEKGTKTFKKRKLSEESDITEKETRKIQCEDCGYIGNKNSLRQHKLIHTGVLKYCDKCSYSTVNPCHFKEHVRNV